MTYDIVCGKNPDEQSLAQFAATGGATGPRATCVAGSPSTLPFSHLAPRCHRVTRNATGFQLEITIFARTRLSPLTLAVAHVSLTEGKGVRTVTMQYIPSGRAEDHEAGPVGAAGAWPPQPTANAGPGT